MVSSQLSNVIAFYFNVLFAYGIGAQSSSLSEHFKLNTNKQISEKYPTLVTPCGYAFAIWGLIFLLEFVSVCWQYTLVDDESSLNEHGRIPFVFSTGSYYWGLTCLLQCAWTLAFGWDQIFISTCLMCSLCFTLYQTCQENLLAVQTHLSTADTEGYAFVWAVLPFTIHASWIVVAALVQLNIFFVARKVSANIQVSLALLSLAVLLLLGCYAAGTLLGSIGHARSIASLSGRHIGGRITLLLVLLWAARAIEKKDAELARITAVSSKKVDCEDSDRKGARVEDKDASAVPLSRLQGIALQRFKGVVFRCLLGALVGNLVLLAVKHYQLRAMQDSP